MRCLSPNCPTEQAEGSDFCEHHRDLFATIAAEIDGGKVERIRHYRRKRRTSYKRCEKKGCTNRAAPRESYCPIHLRILDRGTEA